MYSDNDDELEIEESIDIVEDTDKENREPMELILEGVTIEDEIKAIVSMCTNQNNSETSLPLIIRFNGIEETVGHIDFSLENVLTLLTISSEYKFSLRDNVTDETMEIAGKGVDNMADNLERLIRIR